jgi:hypothetical protein
LCSRQCRSQLHLSVRRIQVPPRQSTPSLEPENAFQLHQAARRISTKTRAEDAGWTIDGIGDESRGGGPIDVMARIGEVWMIEQGFLWHPFETAKRSAKEKA